MIKDIVLFYDLAQYKICSWFVLHVCLNQNSQNERIRRMYGTLHCASMPSARNIPPPPFKRGIALLRVFLTQWQNDLYYPG